MAGKRQRPFRRPEDVTRILQRISQSASVDWNKTTPIERAALLSKLDPVYAAYEHQYPLISLDVGGDYFRIQMFGAPAHYNSAKDGFSADYNDIIHKFWKSPVGAENVEKPIRLGPEEYGDDDFLRGWIYMPMDIVLEFFDANAISKKRNILAIRSPLFDRTDPNQLWPDSPTPTNPARWGLVGLASTDEPTQRQVFSAVGSGSGAAWGSTEAGRTAGGWLRNFPLLPNSMLVFENFFGLVATDIVVISMSGFWKFSPYFMAPGDEPDR